MKAGKARGPSGIVVEVILAAGDVGASVICDLAAAIIRWQGTLQLGAKGKGDALDRGNYHGLDRVGHKSPGEDCGWPH